MIAGARPRVPYRGTRPYTPLASPTKSGTPRQGHHNRRPHRGWGLQRETARPRGEELGRAPTSGRAVRPGTTRQHRMTEQRVTRNASTASGRSRCGRGVYSTRLGPLLNLPDQRPVVQPRVQLRRLNRQRPCDQVVTVRRRRSAADQTVRVDHVPIARGHWFGALCSWHCCNGSHQPFVQLPSSKHSTAGRSSPGAGAVSTACVNPATSARLQASSGT